MCPLCAVFKIRRFDNAIEQRAVYEGIIDSGTICALRLAFREPTERGSIAVHCAVHIHDIECWDEFLVELLPRQRVGVFCTQPGNTIRMGQRDVEVTDEDEAQAARLHIMALVHKQTVEFALALVARLGRIIAQRIPPHVLAPVQRIDVDQGPAALHLEDDDPAFRIPSYFARNGHFVWVFGICNDAKMPLPADGPVQGGVHGVHGFCAAFVGCSFQGCDPLLVCVAGADLLEADKVWEAVADEQVAKK